MSGTGELVHYYLLHDKTLNKQSKEKLKAQINLIIDEATVAITITALVEAGATDLIDALKAKRKAFDGTIDRVIGEQMVEEEGE